ncbi:MAG: hypothetical protein BJ554DRAFT_5371 [Olpidium bornovanus]|uniref:Uncharacterized protein n=1 Tax=Olpidium bornovanus TaxID=278681 RepID=A0A8H8A0C9_9FUNG|nr:MAG: hypothetical protein BJ554DRAFT_5371 [Olpidium bornovanus]
MTWNPTSPVASATGLTLLQTEADYQLAIRQLEARLAEVTAAPGAPQPSPKAGAKTIRSKGNARKSKYVSHIPECHDDSCTMVETPCCIPWNVWALPLREVEAMVVTVMVALRASFGDLLGRGVVHGNGDIHLVCDEEVPGLDDPEEVVLPVSRKGLKFERNLLVVHWLRGEEDELLFSAAGYFSAEQSELAGRGIGLGANGTNGSGLGGRDARKSEQTGGCAKRRVRRRETGGRERATGRRWRRLRDMWRRSAEALTAEVARCGGGGYEPTPKANTAPGVTAPGPTQPRETHWVCPATAWH